MNQRQMESGVSIGIRKTLVSLKNGNDTNKTNIPTDFTIKVANTLEEREDVFKLAYHIYLNKGFICKNPQEWLIRSFDASAETLILIAQDKEKNVIGSATLVFDGSSRLPAEKIYSEEIKTLRNQNEKIVEISRLVIDPNFRNSKDILTLLFNYLYIYSYYVKNYTCLTIEVNPRHITYYQELLHFKRIGDLKECPNVKNAPAMLMYVSLKHAQDEALRLSQNKETETRNRSLYTALLKPEQEKLVAYYLEKQATGMTMEEKMYFGFTESGINRAVCV